MERQNAELQTELAIYKKGIDKPADDLRRSVAQQEDNKRIVDEYSQAINKLNEEINNLKAEIKLLADERENEKEELKSKKQECSSLSLQFEKLTRDKVTEENAFKSEIEELRLQINGFIKEKATTQKD